MTEEADRFIAKLCKIGSEPKSYFVVVPKPLVEANNLRNGSIIELQFLNEVGYKYYPRLNGFSVDVQIKRVQQDISRAPLSTIHKMKALEEAKYYLSILTPKSKRHMPAVSVAATTLYVAGVNKKPFEKNIQRLTQIEAADFYDITEVTIRNHLHRGWVWDESGDRLERKQQR